MHGHLKFADWPVLVGHYKGDTIISAEKVLDAELDGRLTHRHRLGCTRRMSTPARWC